MDERSVHEEDDESAKDSIVDICPWDAGMHTVSQARQSGTARQYDNSNTTCQSRETIIGNLVVFNLSCTILSMVRQIDSPLRTTPGCPPSTGSR